MTVKKSVYYSPSEEVALPFLDLGDQLYGILRLSWLTTLLGTVQCLPWLVNNTSVCLLGLTSRQELPLSVFYR